MTFPAYSLLWHPAELREEVWEICSAIREVVSDSKHNLRHSGEPKILSLGQVPIFSAQLAGLLGRHPRRALQTLALTSLAQL